MGNSLDMVTRRRTLYPVVYLVVGVYYVACWVVKRTGLNVRWNK
jgi:hypothetical protein